MKSLNQFIISFLSTTRIVYLNRACKPCGLSKTFRAFKSTPIFPFAFPVHEYLCSPDPQTEYPLGQNCCQLRNGTGTSGSTEASFLILETRGGVMWHFCMDNLQKLPQFTEVHICRALHNCFDWWHYFASSSRLSAFCWGRYPILPWSTFWKLRWILQTTCKITYRPRYLCLQACKILRSYQCTITCWNVLLMWTSMNFRHFLSFL